MLADQAPAAAPVAQLDYADFVRQRKDDIARDIREQRERSLRIADGIADNRIRLAFLKAEADHERAIADFWRRFFRKIRKQRNGAAQSAERHRSSDRHRSSKGGASRAPSSPSGPPSGAIQLASYSGPVLDRKGRRGVYLAASYLSSKTATYGCSRRLVRYVTDFKHVEWLDGMALCGSNVGDTRTEMSAAFGLVEDLNRAARANAKVVFHLIVQLPHDITPTQRAEIMRRWCEDQFGLRNLPYVWAVHTPDADGDQRNYHGHVAVSFRSLVRVAPFVWDAGRELKAELDNPEQFRVMREQFARTMTEVAHEAGKNREYTALSHAARGMKIKPTEHLGAHKTRLVRQGEYVSTDARNRAKIKRNEAMLKIEQLTRRRAAMERRLARVRRIEARSIDPVHAAARPKRPVAIKVGRAAATPRTGWTRPTVACPPAVASDTAIRQPLRKPSTAWLPNKFALRLVALPSGAVRDGSRPILKSNAMIAAARPTAEPGLPNSVNVAQIIPVGSTGPTPVTVSEVQRPMRAHVRLDPPMPSSRPQRQVATDIMAVRPLALRQQLPTGSRIAVPAAIYEVEATLVLSVAARAVSAADRLGRPDVTLTTPVLVVSRSSGVLRSAKRDPAISQADRPPPAASRMDMDLLHAAFGERAARRRARAKAGAPRAVLALVASLDWGHISTDPNVTLDKLEALDQTEPLTPAPTTAIAERIRTADFYVHDDGTGRLELDPRAMVALGLIDAQLGQEIDQVALASIRTEQQQIIAKLAEEAKRRPLDFARHDKRFWPRDLVPAVLARLDRWAADDGFQNDVAVIERTVRAAHKVLDTQRATPIVPLPTPAIVAPPKLARPVPDGFGGMRDTPPPAYRLKEVGVKLLPFDKVNGRPGKSLLMLLRHCGEHPHSIAFADDERLTALDDIPKLIDPLIHMWRRDDRVQALVVETVRASRKAGRPVWPQEHAAAIRALSPATEPSRAPPSDRDFGPSL